jgi:hypothetical protein
VYFNEAIEEWNIKSNMALHPSSTSSQRQWDLPIIEHFHNNLLSSSDVTQKAILLAVSEPESGAWLDALPSSKLGTLLEKTTLQIAVSLRLGISICQPHICTCGSFIDTLSHHGLSCIKSAGTISRHSCLNDILKRAFSSPNIPCILEPTGVLRDDGKRPDGITNIPWKKGKSLVSHLSDSSITFLLRLLWRRWVLGAMMHFLCFLCALVLRFRRGNAASVIGTVLLSSTFKELFYLL